MKEIVKERIISVATTAGTLAGSYVAYQHGKNPANKPLSFWQGQSYNVVGGFVGLIFGLFITDTPKPKW